MINEYYEKDFELFNYKKLSYDILMELKSNIIDYADNDIKILSDKDIINIIYNNDIIKKIKKNNNKIYLLSFGNEKFYGALERIKIQGLQFKIFDEIIIVKDIDLKTNNEHTEFWNTHKDFIQNNNRGYGYWIWKSYINKYLINKINDNDIILYVDAGCNLNVNGIKLRF